MKTRNSYMRAIILVALVGLLGALACSDSDTGSGAKAQVPATADLAAGQDSFDITAFCFFCHGVNGGGVNDPPPGGFGPPLVGCSRCQAPFETLRSYIEALMPQLDPSLCIDVDPATTDENNCATNTAAHIMCTFNPGLAEGCI